MTDAQKIAAFAAALAVVFAAALGVGALVGGAPTAPATHAEVPVPEAAEPALPAGLAATQDGYTLQLGQTIVPSGAAVPLTFRVTDPSGATVTDFVDSHEKQLHLIVVRRDLTGYQHVHPVLDSSGTWSVPLNLREAGAYRVFADFVPAGGPALTLGTDLQVAGRYDPQPLPAAASTAMVDGYTVTLTGVAAAGEPSELTLSVSRAGKPVTDLQPYLGAYGHLVALRASDLAYLHVHPMGEPGDGTPAGPGIGFHTAFASPGEYRLYLDFKHGDVVRTAEFTVAVPRATQPATTPSAPAPADGHGH